MRSAFKILVGNLAEKRPRRELRTRLRVCLAEKRAFKETLCKSEVYIKSLGGEGGGASFRERRGIFWDRVSDCQYSSEEGTCSMQLESDAHKSIVRHWVIEFYEKWKYFVPLDFVLSSYCATFPWRSVQTHSRFRLARWDNIVTCDLKLIHTQFRFLERV